MGSISGSTSQGVESSSIFAFATMIHEIDLARYFRQAIDFFSFEESQYDISESKWNNAQHILFVVGVAATVVGLSRLIFVGLKGPNQEAKHREQLESARRGSEKSLAEKETELVGLRTRIGELEEELESARSESGERLATTKTELATANGRVKQLEEELERARRESEESLAAKENELGELCQQMESLKENEKLIGEMTYEVANSQETLEALNQEIKTKKARIDKLESELAEVQKAIEANEELNRELRTSLEEQEKQLGQQITDLSGEVSIQKTRVTELEGQLTSLISEKERLEGVNADLQQEVADQLQAAEAKETNFARIQEELSQIQKTFIEQTRKIADLEKEPIDAAQEVAQLKGELEILRATEKELAAARQAISDLTKKSEEQEAKLSEYQKNSREFKKRIGNLRDALNAKEATLTDLTKEFSRVRSVLSPQIAASTEKNAASEREIRRLRSELEKITKDYTVLQAEFKNAKDAQTPRRQSEGGASGSRIPKPKASLPRTHSPAAPTIQELNEALDNVKATLAESQINLSAVEKTKADMEACNREKALAAERKISVLEAQLKERDGQIENLTQHLLRSPLLQRNPPNTVNYEDLLKELSQYCEKPPALDESEVERVQALVQQSDAEIQALSEDSSLETIRKIEKFNEILFDAKVKISSLRAKLEEDKLINQEFWGLLTFLETAHDEIDAVEFIGNFTRYTDIFTDRARSIAAHDRRLIELTVNINHLTEQLKELSEKVQISEFNQDRFVEVQQGKLEIALQDEQAGAASLSPNKDLQSNQQKTIAAMDKLVEQQGTPDRKRLQAWTRQLKKEAEQHPKNVGNLAKEIQREANAVLSTAQHKENQVVQQWQQLLKLTPDKPHEHSFSFGLEGSPVRPFSWDKV